MYRYETEASQGFKTQARLRTKSIRHKTKPCDWANSMTSETLFVCVLTRSALIMYPLHVETCKPAYTELLMISDHKPKLGQSDLVYWVYRKKLICALCNICAIYWLTITNFAWYVHVTLMYQLVHSLPGWACFQSHRGQDVKSNQGGTNHRCYKQGLVILYTNNNNNKLSLQWHTANERNVTKSPVATTKNRA